MQFTQAFLSLFALVVSTVAAPLAPSQGVDPSCFPISKLTSQLIKFQEFSTLILRDAPIDFNAAKTDAKNGFDSIVSAIDLLNPQIQPLQDNILADLATVGLLFNRTVQASNSTIQVQLATRIQHIL